MSRRAKIAGGVLGGIALAVVVFFVVMYASVSGGWDDAFRPKKSASDEDVREAREKAEPAHAQRVEALTAAIRAEFGKSFRSAEADRARSECQEGQHNWKIDDEYDVRCELVTEIALHVRAGNESPRNVLHRSLSRERWTTTGLGIREKGFAFYEAPGYRLQVQSADGTFELTLRHLYFEG